LCRVEKVLGGKPVQKIHSTAPPSSQLTVCLKCTGEENAKAEEDDLLGKDAPLVFLLVTFIWMQLSARLMVMESSCLAKGWVV